MENKIRCANSWEIIYNPENVKVGYVHSHYTIDREKDCLVSSSYSFSKNMSTNEYIPFKTFDDLKKYLKENYNIDVS